MEEIKRRAYAYLRKIRGRELLLQSFEPSRPKVGRNDGSQDRLAFDQSRESVGRYLDLVFGSQATPAKNEESKVFISPFLVLESHIS